MDYSLDDKQKLSFEDIHRPGAEIRFKRSSGGLALGYSQSVLWVRLRLNNVQPVARRLFLDLKPMVLNDVEVFSPNLAPQPGGSLYRSVLVGDHHPLSLRPVISTTNVIPVDIPPGVSEIYIRVHTTSSLALTGWLRTAEAQISESALQAARFSGFEALLVFSGVANLLIWRGLKDRLFLQYAISLLALAVNEFCYVGLLLEEWVIGGGETVDIIGGSSSSVCLCVASLFVRGQTRADQNFPLIGKALLLITAVSGFTLAMTIAGRYQLVAPLVMMSAVSVFAVGFLGNAWLSFKRVPGAGIATCAFGALLIGMMVVSLRLTALSPYTHWSDYAFEVAVMFFILYMQLSLARRTRQAEHEQRLAQARALEIALSAEQTALRLVEQRTAELRKAKDAAEDALKAEHEAQAEQIRFVDVISHQYRTPLAVVSNSIATISRSLPQDNINRDRIERIRRAISRLVELIDVSLHRSRLEGASTWPQLKPMALHEVAQALFSMLRDTFGERAAQLDLSVHESDSMLAVDVEMLGVALANLVENALKFSPLLSPVEVRMAVDGDRLILSVSDRGIGIPDGERHLLTQKYFRATNSANTPGMGLGLHMTATIARRHQGRLSHENVAGGGTRAVLELAVAWKTDQDLARILAASTAK